MYIRTYVRTNVQAKESWPAQLPKFQKMSGPWNFLDFWNLASPGLPKFQNLEKHSKLNLLVNKHEDLIKQVGRINNILDNKEVNSNTIEILVLNEKISLKFSEDIDLASQKLAILQKLENLEKKSILLKNKLNNKAYLKNAPKDIVQNDKKLLKELTIEDQKLRSIVSSIN